MILLFCSLALTSIYVFLSYETADKQKQTRLSQYKLNKKISIETELIRQIHQIKFIGYLHRFNHMCAVLLFPNGKVLDVEKGALLPSFHSYVARITENEIVIALPSQHVISLPFLHVQ